MTDFLRYAGIIIILIGVIVLSIYTFQHMVSNTLLITGGALLVLGTGTYITLNKYIDE